jgi:hypothetical protein
MRRKLAQDNAENQATKVERENGRRKHKQRLISATYLFVRVSCFSLLIHLLRASKKLLKPLCFTSYLLFFVSEI